MKNILLAFVMILITSCAFVQKEKTIEFIQPKESYTNVKKVYISSVSSPRYLDTDDMAYIYKHQLRYFAKHRFPCSLNCTVKNYLLEALPYLVEKPISDYKLSIYIYDFEPSFKTFNSGNMILKARFYLKYKNTYKIEDFNYNKAFSVKDFSKLMEQENMALQTMAKKLNSFIKDAIITIKEGKNA
ncbi:hypothetical protein HY04AAS1_0177 [Hydrogenobaculum sp. Y04AAS1]|uniref:hypothetical protein n=1 Tax=Hydrogenobaculum sp. (strain Y04AAS1) TaxID=380749 RepID=UPI00015BCFB4|nr:hypothetical protein HY04AAS1_0177 [Hydrogenobaculum sp. Y04AAS1]HCT67191.1 hypothetical protein [Hydrogenobaculum sp.]